MKRKKPYTFTLNKDLMEWFKFYAKEEDRSMSSLLNSFILDLKRSGNQTTPTPNNVMKVKWKIY